MGAGIGGGGVRACDVCGVNHENVIASRDSSNPIDPMRMKVFNLSTALR